jgi:hypothetical protein
MHTHFGRLHSCQTQVNNVRDIEMEEDCDGKIYHDGICCMMALCQEDNGDGDVQGFMCMPSWR